MPQLSTFRLHRHAAGFLFFQHLGDFSRQPYEVGRRVNRNAHDRRDPGRHDRQPGHNAAMAIDQHDLSKSRRFGQTCECRLAECKGATEIRMVVRNTGPDQGSPRKGGLNYQLPSRSFAHSGCKDVVGSRYKMRPVLFGRTNRNNHNGVVLCQGAQFRSGQLAPMNTSLRIFHGGPPMKRREKAERSARNDDDYDEQQRQEEKRDRSP